MAVIGKEYCLARNLLSRGPFKGVSLHSQLSRTTQLFELPPRHLPAERCNFDRKGEFPQTLHQFAMVYDNNIVYRGRSDDLFPEQGSAAPLDQVQLFVHLIGPVDRQVDMIHIRKGQNRDSRLSGQRLGL